MAQVPLSAFYGLAVNGLSATSPLLSGYTLATPFTCQVVADQQYTQAAITTDHTLIWWFGDGTYSTDYSPSHIYSWPGVYEVKLGIFNNNPGTLAVNVVSALDIEDLKVQVGGTDYLIKVSNGTSPITFSLTVTANNYIQDALTWDYSQWPDLSGTQPASGACFHGYQSCKTGTVNGPIPITFNYLTSLKNNSDIQFRFYSENSLSQPWTQVPDSQLANLRPRWRFTTVSASPLDDGLVITEYTPISSTEVRILSSGVLSSTGTLVGLSGSQSFYYIDDIPSLVVHNYTGTPVASANPTRLWVTLETMNIPNPQSLEYINVPSYANSMVSLSSYFYVETLIPDHLSVTINGTVPFNPIYWPTAESRFVTTINSFSGTNGLSAYRANKPLLNFPINASVAASAGNTFGTSLVITGVAAASAVFNTSSAPTTGNYLQYNINRSDTLGRDTGGYYIGTFTPYTTGSAVLSAYTVLNGLTFLTDVAPSTATGYNPLYLVTSPGITYNAYFNGSSQTFNIIDFDSTFFARKFNQGFDYGRQLKDYALQPTINQNEVMFDDYLPAVAGTSATNEDTFGGVAYEKIANFVSNISDPSTANISQFYSLAESLGLELDNYDYDIPPALSRIVDLYSTQQSRIVGSRSLFARNFANSKGHTNLGSTLSAYDICTTMVYAGQRIVANDIFNTQYFELIEVPRITSYAAVTARGLQSKFPTSAYPLSSYPLLTYPLSAFFGCGLATPVINNYRFFVYDSTPNGTQVEGLVNWDDELSTLTENASAHADWVKDGGTLETIFNYYIHKGLGLI